MNNQAVFQRYEMKYLITEAQYARLKEKICRYMIDDRYGQSSICNLYFDTPSFLLIRRSIERPVYKEKLRLRSYGVAVPDSTVFIEMKKKYRSVVYKRRIDPAALAQLCKLIFVYIEQKERLRCAGPICKHSVNNCRGHVARTNKADFFLHFHTSFQNRKHG